MAVAGLNFSRNLAPTYLHKPVRVCVPESVNCKVTHGFAQSKLSSSRPTEPLISVLLNRNTATYFCATRKTFS